MPYSVATPCPRPQCFSQGLSNNYLDVDSPLCPCAVKNPASRRALHRLQLLVFRCTVCMSTPRLVLHTFGGKPEQ